jgi:hypothetical protein
VGGLLLINPQHFNFLKWGKFEKFTRKTLNVAPYENPFPLALPRTRKNSYPNSQIAAQSTGLWEPVTASTARSVVSPRSKALEARRRAALAKLERSRSFWRESRRSSHRRSGSS